MGHKNRNTGGTLRDQVYNRLQGKQGFGRSKSEDKRNGISSRYIYSFNSMKTYMKHAFYFVEWCKASPDIRAAIGHKPRTLEECENYVEAFIRDREKQGFSAYTVKMEKSALAKLYGHDFDFETIATRRRDITRSRKEHTEGDKHFSEAKNAELVNACRCIGFRRSELEKASAADLFQAGGFWFVRIVGKGGRLRAARIVGTDEEINRAVEYVKTLDGNNHVSSAADIHSYRAEYATRVYLSAARDIDGLKGEKIDYTELTGKVSKNGSRIYKSAVYYCRGDQRGLALDRAAMIIASQNLGHNRESVVGEHYLRLSK